MRLPAKRLMVGILAPALTAGVFFVWQSEKAGRASSAATPVATTITIDPTVGETFSPPPSSAQPAESAQQAWAAYAQQLGSSATTIPGTVTVQLGQLTLPVGPRGPNNSEVYTADNELAYGYSWASPCLSTLADSPPANCTEWLFLDANSGNQIDNAWQH